MTDTEFLKNYLTETALLELREIFCQARSGNLSQAEERELNQRLSDVLKHDRHWNQRIRDIAPSGRNYLVTSVGGCILVNIYGAMLIFDSPLYFEGDVAIRKIRWMEEDRLLVFEAHNIPYSETETYICHYSKDDNAFVYFTPSRSQRPDSCW